MIEAANIINWPSQGDTEVTWEQLKQNIILLSNVFAPLKIARKHKELLWWKSSVSRAMSRKRAAWSRFTSIGGFNRHLQYIQFRNAVEKIKRRCQRTFESRLARNAKRNPKAFFRYSQSKRATKKSVGSLMDNRSNVASTSKHKADYLLAYFQSVHRVDNSANPLLDSHVFPIIPTVMPPISFTAQGVRKQGAAFCRYKSAGADGIQPAILKPLAGLLAVPLATLYEKCLLDRRLPSDWKTTIVMSIHKGGASDIVSNYRPISLTSMPLKIMERLIRDHIASHLASQGALTAQQHGFVAKKSCFTNLICFPDEITRRLDNHEQVEVCYLELHKAFDSVNHRLLLLKMRNYNLEPTILDWISEFLADRTLVVSARMEQSIVGWVTSGVP